MNFRKTLSSVHLIGTVWFILCTGYIFILAMSRAGFNWLIIFSLSGYAAFIVTLLVSLYLFTIFRGTGSGTALQKEHPLTSTTYYMAFYVSTPFLGVIAGVLGMLGETRVESLRGAIAMGSIIATFLTWIVVDSIVGSVEMLTPLARSHRTHRLARARLLKQYEQTHREQMLARALERKGENNRLWGQALAHQANKLANLLACDEAGFSKAEKEAIRLGVEAWQMGGLSCMRHLRNMAAELFRQKHNARQFVDYTSAWWDGIGRWRNPSLVCGWPDWKNAQ
jgi:hypothetical protein